MRRLVPWALVAALAIVVHIDWHFARELSRCSKPRSTVARLGTSWGRNDGRRSGNALGLGRPRWR